MVSSACSFAHLKIRMYTCNNRLTVFAIYLVYIQMVLTYIYYYVTTHLIWMHEMHVNCTPLPNGTSRVGQ